MKRQTLLLLIIPMLLCSCDYVFHSEGIIMNKETLNPIDSAIIFIKDIDSVYSDSSGRFKIDKIMSGTGTDFEILVEKKGYLPVYLNYSERSDSNNTLIKMQSTDKEFKPFFPRKLVRFSYYTNMVVWSIFNVFTMIFILSNKNLRKRFLWIIGILIFNLTFYFLFLDGTISKFSIINGPFYLTHYWMHPYSIKVGFPIVSILFWVFYKIKPELIKRQN